MANILLHMPRVQKRRPVLPRLRFSREIWLVFGYNFRRLIVTTFGLILTTPACFKAHIIFRLLYMFYIVFAIII